MSFMPRLLLVAVLLFATTLLSAFCVWMIADPPKTEVPPAAFAFAFLTAALVLLRTVVLTLRSGNIARHWLLAGVLCFAYAAVVATRVTGAAIIVSAALLVVLGASFLFAGLRGHTLHNDERPRRVQAMLTSSAGTACRWV